MMKKELITQLSTRWLIVWFVSSLVAGFLVISCASMGLTCDFDSDCEGGALCVEKVCSNPCTSDQLCTGNDTCQVFIRANEADQVRVCMPSPHDDVVGNNTDTAQCLDDEECQEILGSAEAICGLGFRCVMPEAGASPEVERFDSVLIHDRTPRALVDEHNHPGTVLSAVFVRDKLGSIVGYGDTLAFVSVAAGQETAEGHLDGQPVQLDESGQCVAGDSPAMSPLGGEGSYYLVSFVDYRGARISLGQGWKVIVIGWSAQCGDSLEIPVESGEYEVSLCVSSRGIEAGFEADCQKVDGKVSGYTEFLVTENG